MFGTQLCQLFFSFLMSCVDYSCRAPEKNYVRQSWKTINHSANCIKVFFLQPTSNLYFLMQNKFNMVE